MLSGTMTAQTASPAKRSGNNQARGWSGSQLTIGTSRCRKEEGRAAIPMPASPGSTLDKNATSVRSVRDTLRSTRSFDHGCGHRRLLFNLHRYAGCDCHSEVELANDGLQIG